MHGFRWIGLPPGRTGAILHRMDDLLEFLVRCCLAPFRIWRDSNENSRIGTSEFEEEAERFWFRFGTGGVCLVIAVLGVGAGVVWAVFLR